MGVSGVSYIPDRSDSGEEEFTHVVATITASGNTTVYTPTSGRSVRLRWVYAINSPGSTANPLIRIFLGAQEKYRAYAISKRQMVTGPVDGPVIINLDAAASVAVTILLEEV